MENNFYLIGVGGQGLIRLGQIIADYGLEKGEKVRFFKEAKAKIIWIDAGRIAREAGLPIAENIVLLGALSFISSFDKEAVINMLKKHIPRELDKNIAAFRAGYEMAEGMDK